MEIPVSKPVIDDVNESGTLKMTPRMNTATIESKTSDPRVSLAPLGSSACTERTMFCPSVSRPSVNPHIPIITANLRLTILAPTAVPTAPERLLPATSATHRNSVRGSRIVKNHFEIHAIIETKLSARSSHESKISSNLCNSSEKWTYCR